MLTDDHLREVLLAIDESEDICVTSWEADFIESAVYQWKGEWTPKQRRTVMAIVDKYRDQLK